MAAGSPVSQRNGRATSARYGTVLQGVAVANLTSVATSGSLPTANGSVTIADATTPTVVELLEYCFELETKLEALLASLRTSGALAS
jgi:hypothetical protein